MCIADGGRMSRGVGNILLDLCADEIYGKWSFLASKLESVEFPVDDVTDDKNEAPTEKNEESWVKENETKDIGCLTEVCSSSNLPEVEIFSLIEEQIPKYRLRSDSITDFCGYDNNDWIQTPLIPIDEDLELTTEQIDETLKYFVLCGERLTQMTKTYNDIEAVNRLLEEKERDLELAARIGQTLLTKNQELEGKNEELEDQLNIVVDKVNQLKHEIILKESLLQAFTDYEVSGSPDDDSLSDDSLQSHGVKSLQKKVETLEEENVKLKLETAQLSAETFDYEEKEAKLVNDCVQQFAQVKKDLELYVEELNRKTEENSAQKEEITGLLGQVVDLQLKVKVVTAENLELQKHLEASQQSQKFLTKQIAELKDKHDELVALYEVSQEEVRQLRRKQKPGAVRHNYMSSSLLSLPSDSLASELESSLKGDMDYPKGYSPAERKVHNWKVFETVKAAKKSGSRCPSIRSTSMGASNYSLNDSVDSAPISNRSSMYFSDVDSGPENPPGSDLDGLYGTRNNLGRPGIPGSNDLETALRKLSLRRANELNEQDYKEDEQKRQRKKSENEEGSTPGVCQTPDSTLSTGSGLSGLSGMSNMTGSSSPYYRLPEKLRIVKPLEGSVTLRQWQQLATPNLGGIFESRPGVQIKGERKLDLEEEQHNLSDLEEDDDIASFPAFKGPQESWTINTFTNSLVKHPSCNTSDLDDDEDLSDIESLTDASTPLVSTPRMATQQAPSQSQGSSYGMGLGLAAILGESDLLSPKKETDDEQTIVASSDSSMVSDKTVTNFAMGNCYTVPSSGDPLTQTKTSPVPSIPGGNEHSRNFMSKLKNTGVSLYGYLGNWGHNSSSTETEAIPPSAVVTPDSTLTSEESSGTKSSTMSAIFGSTTRSNVLGALTSFQRNGIL